MISFFLNLLYQLELLLNLMIPFHIQSLKNMIDVLLCFLTSFAWVRCVTLCIEKLCLFVLENVSGVNSLSVIPLMPDNTNVSLFSLHFNGPGRGYLAWIYRCCTVNNFMKPPNNKNFPCVSSLFDGMSVNLYLWRFLETTPVPVLVS